MNAGDRVKFLSVFPLAPYSVYDKLGEVGTAVESVVTRKNERVWTVWKVRFDDGERIWIKQKDLEVVDA